MMRNFHDPLQKISYQYQQDFSASKKASDHIITTDEALKQDEDYKIIKKHISRLIESGLSKMGEGYCISVSDIIFNVLKQNGIKCSIVEVQLSIFDKKKDTTSMVGFNTTFTRSDHEKVSTHIVVVTHTKIPILIDMSIGHHLPGNYQCVMEKVDDGGSKVICTTEKDGHTLIYQEKRDGISIPSLHQISILDRMETDRRIFSTLDKLRHLNYIGIVLSTFALLNVLAKILFPNIW